MLTGLSRGGIHHEQRQGNWATSPSRRPRAAIPPRTAAPNGGASGLCSAQSFARIVAEASTSTAQAAPVVARADGAPTASDPVVTELPDGTAQVTRTTSEPTNAAIGLGSTPSTLVDHGVDASLVTSHQAVLTDFEPNSTVWVQTSSTDADGHSVDGLTLPVVVPGPGAADQSWASFKRGATTGQATIDTSGMGAVTLSAPTASDGPTASPRVSWTLRRWSTGIGLPCMRTSPIEPS